MGRRLAAIMFTDLVGSTSLAQTDEKDALALLREQGALARPVLDAYHGRLVKSTGDGMLVEFANALDAIECAVEFQRRVHERSTRDGRIPLQVRIGIHVGDVESEGTDILGDAVNIAARIEPLAEAGGISLSGPVYDQVSNKAPYQFEKLGPKTLRGVVKPMEIYRVVLPWAASGGLRPREVSGPPRLAILPLANMSSDPENEYFADGVTEELISTASKVPELGVISRTSVMTFKKPGTPLREIGRQLEADWVLEGSVRKSGSRVRITVQLIHAGADRHLWTESYDRNLEDIFAVQSEIAQKVASELRIRLGDEDRERIRKPPTQDARAHLFYLRGMASTEQGTAEGYHAAIESFQAATREDPMYALAYLRLANCYGILSTWEDLPPREARPRQEAAVQRALEIDPSLAEAHLSLAELRAGPPRWELTASAQETARARELNPNLVGAHLIWGYLSFLSGKREEGLSSLEKALSLDPLSPRTIEQVATAYLYLGDPEGAAALFERSLGIDANRAFARNNLGVCRAFQGRSDEAIAEIRKSIEMDRGYSAAQRADLVYVLVRAGRVEEARDALEELLEHYRTRAAGSYAIASAYASLGQPDQAFEWLETAYREQVATLRLLPLDYPFVGLRDDPRFRAMLARIGH